MDKVSTPEWDRYRALENDWAYVKEFVEEAKKHGVVLAQYKQQMGIRRTGEPLERYTGDLDELLAKLYDIDLVKVEREKRLVLNMYLKILEGQSDPNGSFEKTKKSIDDLEQRYRDTNDIFR